MQSQKRRQYTAAFTHEAVRLITAHGYGVTDAARNLGIHAPMFGRWKRQSEQQQQALRRNGHLSADHEELLRWRTENQRLRMACDMLKKTVRFFASESRCNRPAFWSTSQPGRSRCGVRCWGWGAAGCMPTKSGRLRPGSVAKRWTCWSVAKR